jgi:hypothetical protein
MAIASTPAGQVTFPARDFFFCQAARRSISADRSSGLKSAQTALPTDAALLFEEPLRKFSDRRHSLAILAVSQFARTEAVCYCA